MRATIHAVTAVVTMAASGCASHGAMPVATTGRMGSSLAAYGHDMPRGAEACALEAGMKAPTGAPVEPMSAECGAQMASDQLWSTALRALGAYATGIEELAAGGDPEQAGKVEAELVLVRDENFVDVEGEEEQQARKAAYELVQTILNRDSKAKLEEAVKEAKPHVEKLCDGLLGYFGEEEERFSKLADEVQQKPSQGRCAQQGGTTICVANNTLDRMNHAALVGHLLAMRAEHDDARNSIAAFCVAHYTVARAAESGTLDKKETNGEVLTVVHDAVPVGADLPSEE